MQADFEEIYNEYSKRLYLYIYVKCRNWNIAEDVLQTTFLKAIENIDSFRGECSIYTWLCHIAINILRSEFRRNEYKNTSLEQLSETNPELLTVDNNDPLKTLIEKEEADEINRRLSRLKPEQQKIINMRLKNIPFKEIAESLGKSETWAKTNYHRAIKKMKRLGE